jgi:uncharacterized protein YjiK
MSFYHIRVIGAVLFLLLLGCRKTEDPFGNNLILLAYYPLSISETSGLSYYDSDDRLLTVSDLTGKVYVISITGEVLDTLPFMGEDLEGVAFDRVTSQIFVVEEKTNEVIELDTNGNEVNRFKVKIDNLLPKHGLEGITVNTDNGNLLLVSEKLPGLLIEVTRSGEEIARHILNFAQDYSSVFFDPYLKNLWILSDESQSLTLCSLTGVPIQTWQTRLKKGEGLVIDSRNELIYIVTDNESGLYVFRMKL